MTTTTLLHRPTGPRTPLDRVQQIFSIVSAKLAEIYGRQGSVEPKTESWRYFSA
ncbi:hypothetical protein SAMN04489859_100917 [Paracoccus alcaliphilus]|uniref:Uncharacterized protein n=1 Tax=Paracoccus alcaliphilus TaxID=34002 RepID=A0A1H8HCJ3_9RHOB|nr:hypothetical protein [Paracoccus alcaliphilus]WCR20660.1 hypothetical protein JHW40_20640 [Paracoccus alcaliphilus]SEN53835.1 hypothetical protein SAMN04489859_100917 [Paracoccus alcaliphilus]